METIVGPPTKEGLDLVIHPCPFVRSSVLTFLKNHALDFLKFCTNFKHDMSKKVTERIFRHNSGCPSRGLFRVKNAPKWLKMALLCILQKIEALDFHKTC